MSMPVKVTFGYARASVSISCPVPAGENGKELGRKGGFVN